MTTESTQHSRRLLWRLLLILLVVLPFLPEIAIYLVSALAEAGGCKPGETWVCLIAGTPVSDVIVAALEFGLVVSAGFGVGGAAVWLALCYLLVTLGWARLASRLSLAFVIMLIFAFGPYFGPMLALGNLVNPNCHPNEGGVGPCVIFGGDVGSPAHETVTAPWLMFLGAPMALATFAVYVIVVIVVRVVSARRAASAAP